LIRDQTRERRYAVSKEELRKKEEEAPDVEGHLKDDFGAKDDFGDDFGRKDKDDEDDFEGHALRDDFGDDFEPGDVFIVNDPYRGGTHNQDVRLVRPIFLDGEVFAYAAACAH
jgi:hypothetical protein